MGAVCLHRLARLPNAWLPLSLIVLAVPAVLLHADAAFAPDYGLVLANPATQSAVHAFGVVSLLRDQIMALDGMFAAASPYVLAAFVFAYLYALVERYSPASFAIYAVNDHARSPVTIEQMTGVLYLTPIISHLAALQARRHPDGG